jgi:cystathionine beta-lyase
MTDFDSPQDRSDTSSEKWDREAMRAHFGRDDLLPFWVADMEFQAPPEVVQSLIERARHGIFGYEVMPGSVRDAVTQWYAKRHGWKIEKSHICFSHGVMNAITMLIDMHTEKGDGVIIQTPVFFEFRLGIVKNHRKVIRNPLKVVDGRYRMDFEDLEKTAADPRAKMLILCNPHNPVGRVWERDELKRLGEICSRNDVLIIADEIHSDVVYPGHRYVPFASAVSDAIAERSFTCLSPAKTFNIASVTESPIIIPDQRLREQFEHYLSKFFLDKPGAFSSVAMQIAYRDGEAWLDRLLAYLQDNINYLRNFLETRIADVKLIEPEGTFLVWLDFRALGLDAKDLEKFLAQEARIALNSGHWFGRQGAGFARMNIGCTRSMLEEGLTRLEQAVNAMRKAQK